MSDNKKVCWNIKNSLFIRFQNAILNKYGSIYGNLGKSLEEGIELWLEKNDNSNQEGDIAIEG